MNEYGEISFLALQLAALISVLKQFNQVAGVLQTESHSMHYTHAHPSGNS